MLEWLCRGVNMNAKKILIIILFILTLLFFNVYADDTYTDSYINNNQSAEQSDDDSEYLEPADTSGYDVYDNVSLEGGGTYLPVEIWTFRIAVVAIIGTIVILYNKKKNNKYDSQEDKFYER